MPFSYRDETKEVNALARQEASGSFMQLSDGFTHYELSNPHARKTVVLVHGFSVPYFIFDPTFAFLTQSGFRVLRYDVLGRGFSDRPDACYDIHLFVRQLGDLLDALQLAQILKAAALPGIGEALVGMIASVRMARRIATSPFDRERIGEFGPRYLAQMEYKGFKHALLSTIRGNMLGSFLDVYKQVGKMGKPVLLIWGRQDHIIPFHHSSLLRVAMPNMEFYVVEESGHIPHYEKSREVNPVLLRFLRRSQ